MSSYFHPRGANDSWARIGRLEITSTVAVVLLGAAGVLVGVVAPSLLEYLVFTPDQVLRGQIWRVFTWPLAETISLWSALTLLMLWYFGRHLEHTLGRNTMAWLYLGCWAALTLAATVIRVVGQTGLAGLQLVQFAILLLWIAQYPTMRFLFNIPAWAFGAFIVALNVLSLIASRAFANLLVLLLGLGLIAIIARRLGLLSQYSWMPGRPRRSPTRRIKSQARQQQRRQSAGERIDELLDKINAEGLHSLTKKERAELEKLRQQRRG